MCCGETGSWGGPGGVREEPTEYAVLKGVHGHGMSSLEKVDLRVERSGRIGD